MGVKDDMSGLMSGGEFIGIELMEGIELSKVSVMLGIHNPYRLLSVSVGFRLATILLFCYRRRF